MAGRELEGLGAKKYVCISAPQKPYPPINLIRKKLGVSELVIKRYKDFLAGQFNCRWEEITQRAYASEPEGQLLLIYDETDRFVEHTDGDRASVVAGLPTRWVSRVHLHVMTTSGSYMSRVRRYTASSVPEASTMRTRSPS